MSTQLKTFLDMVKRQDYLVLDTETTGLKNAEICQIAIINHTGEILLNTLVQPTKPIPHEAWRIHGISDEMVADAPPWGIVGQAAWVILSEHDNLVVYNAKFDRHMLYSSDEHVGVQKQLWKERISWHCAMENYAEFYAHWCQRRQSWKWQTLTNAAVQMSLDINNAHSALGDCQTTLALIQAMALEP
ncbi:hypothetical protein LCGC14_1169440 [marine sediment metagenome]|uniref:Exonuclease domain-containing protein n=1 Tax=marine sediment metagenome TaxID=412755 RepID=A0A0F9LQD6_9ZZZZ